MRIGMTEEELKRFESLEKLVHKQTDKILEMQSTIQTLRAKVFRLKGRSRNREETSPVPALLSPPPQD